MSAGDTPTPILISVVIPIYKVEDLLCECVDSVLAQSYDALDVILVDDGSPDGSPQICDMYAAKDQRVRVIHKENGGLSDARNHGTQIARGEYVIYLDSDDYWCDKNAVAEAVAILQEHASRGEEIDMLYFDCRILSCRGKGERLRFKEPYELKSLNGVSKVEALEYLISNDRFIVTAWSKFVRRKLLMDNNITFKKGLLSEDYDWNFWVVCKSRKLHFFNNDFYLYRLREGSITSRLSAKHLNDIWSIIADWYQKIPIVVKQSEEAELYLDFLAYMYGVLMSLLADAPSKDLIAQMKPYAHLLRRTRSKKVSRVWGIYRIFGFNITWRILGVLNYIRRRLC